MLRRLLCFGLVPPWLLLLAGVQSLPHTAPQSAVANGTAEYRVNVTEHSDIVVNLTAQLDLIDGQVLLAGLEPTTVQSLPSWLHWDAGNATLWGHSPGISAESMTDVQLQPTLTVTNIDAYVLMQSSATGAATKQSLTLQLVPVPKSPRNNQPPRVKASVDDVVLVPPMRCDRGVDMRLFLPVAQLFGDADGDQLELSVQHAIRGQTLPDWLGFNASLSVLMVAGQSFTCSAAMQDTVDGKVSFIAAANSSSPMPYAYLPLILTAKDPFNATASQPFNIVLMVAAPNGSISGNSAWDSEWLRVPVAGGQAFNESKSLQIPFDTAGTDVTIMWQYGVSANKLDGHGRVQSPMPVSTIGDNGSHPALLFDPSPESVGEWWMTVYRQSATNSGWLLPNQGNSSGSSNDTIQGRGIQWSQVYFTVEAESLLVPYRLERDNLSLRQDDASAEALQLSRNQFNMSGVADTPIDVDSNTTLHCCFGVDVFVGSVDSVQATDSLGRALPDWLQWTETVDGRYYCLDGFTAVASDPGSNSSVAAASSIRVVVTAAASMSALSESFAVDIVVAGHALPVLDLAAYQFPLLFNVTAGEPFSIDIPSALFTAADGGSLAYSLASSVDASVQFQAESIRVAVPAVPVSVDGSRLVGTVQQSTAITIVATDEFGGFAAVDADIVALPFGVGPDNGAPPGISAAWKVAIIVVVSLVVVILVVVLCCIFVRRRRRATNTDRTYGDKVGSLVMSVKDNCRGAARRLGLVRRKDGGSKLELLSDNRDSYLHGDGDLHGYLVVTAVVGRAFHYVYAVDELLDQLHRPVSGLQRTDSASKQPFYTADDATLPSGYGSLSGCSLISTNIKGVHNQPVTATAAGSSYRECGGGLTTSVPGTTSSAISLCSSTFSDEQSMDDGDDSLDLDNGVQYGAVLYPSGVPLPGWLHFNPKKCSFFGIPYVYDTGDWKVEVSAYRLDYNSVANNDDDTGPRIIDRASRVFSIVVEPAESVT